MENSIHFGQRTQTRNGENGVDIYEEAYNAGNRHHECDTNLKAMKVVNLDIRLDPRLTRQPRQLRLSPYLADLWPTLVVFYRADAY